MTGRTIPALLLANLSEPATTTCRIVKITAVDASPIGLTSLDRDVIFDDGTGTLTYKAATGYSPYNIDATSDLSVDNSEWQVLVADYTFDGFMVSQIERGTYDDADFIEYLIDYEDQAAGKMIISSGKVGRIRIEDGLAAFPEARALTQLLKQQSVIEKGSVGCRVVRFGDERCKYDVESEWDGGQVTAVGAETDRTFTIAGSGVSGTADYYSPGVVEFLSGDNAGRTYEIETFTSGRVVTFAIPTENPIQIGDDLQIRRDCTRQWEGHNSCQTYNNRLNFRGEPWRPVADSGALQIPGASAGGTP